jgi:hypothetical protein
LEARKLTITKPDACQAVAHAASLMLRYQGDRIGAQRRAEMRAEVRALGDQVADWGWDDQRIEEEVIAPLADLLTGRFGDEVGSILLDKFLVEFARSFD